MTKTLPTVAELVRLASSTHASIGNHLQIEGRWFRVVHFHTEIRFFERGGRYATRSAHIELLRSDLCKAATLPCAGQDRALAARCEDIVRTAMGAL